jgi:hypothetical protein
VDQVDERFQALLEAAPDAMIGVDAHGTIVWVNIPAIELFGYSSEQLVGQPMDMLVPDSARRVHPQRRAQYAANPQRRPMGDGMECAARRSDGTEFPADISLSSIETSDGLLVCAAVRDATHRQRAARQFRDLLEAAPDAIVFVDSSGVIAMVNSQVEQLFGYERDELVGQPVEVLVPEAARSMHPGLRAGYMGDPHRRPMGSGLTLAGRRRDGSEFPAEISLSAIHAERGVLVSASIRDVSLRLEAEARATWDQLTAQAAREQLEAQLNQARRLEGLGRLAGGVAHDFNNLLGAILNYAEFVGSEIESASLPVEQRERLRHDVAQIQQAVDRGAALTRQLLAFGRREIVRPDVVDLNDVVTHVEELLRRTIGEHIALATVLPDARATILADRGQLEQVLMNLAVNARDAMVGGGTLTIETDVVDADRQLADTFAGLKPGLHVRLRVTDTGVGMTPEALEHAFEPFFTTKPKGGGTGLGLATVYGIITQAGGFAQITSAVNHGTTITAVFPYSDAIVAEQVVIGAPRIVGGTETVLVVEDDTAMRDITRRILQRNGYQVLIANNGPEAIELARTHADPIDLLLSDVVMPTMLGKEVAERVRAIRRDILVLFMSGYAESALSNRGTLEPGTNLLEKPFSEPALLARVRNVLDEPQR